MVNRILNFLNKGVSGVHEAAYVLAFSAFLSQLLGLLRDRLLAHSFGAGATLDVYYAAFRIPDLIVASVASIVSLSVLIPFLADKMEREPDDSRPFISRIFSFYLVLVLAVSAVIYFVVPFLSGYLFPGFSPEDQARWAVMTRIFLLSPVFFGLSNLFASVTQVFRKFFIYALSPILYNFGIIFGIIFLYPSLGPKGLAYGVVLGAFFHLAVQMPFIAKSGFWPRFSVAFDFGEIRRVIFLSLPRTIALSAGKIAEFFLLSSASVIGVGAISVFNLALNIQSVPVSIIGASYSVAAFPTLARMFSRGEKKEFLDQMGAAARHIFFWSAPALALLIVLRAHIVRVILGSGKFDWTATRLTAGAAALFALSVLAQCLVLLFLRGYYAAGETRKPLFINVVSSLVIIASSYFFTKLFAGISSAKYFFEFLLRVDDISGTGVLALPLGYSVGFLFNAGLLWFYFEKDFRGFSRSVKRSFFQSLSVAILAGAVTRIALEPLSEYFGTDTLLALLADALASGGLGILVGVAVLRLMDSRELEETWRALHRRIWRVAPIGGEQQDL